MTDTHDNYYSNGDHHRKSDDASYRDNLHFTVYVSVSRNRELKGIRTRITPRKSS